METCCEGGNGQSVSIKYKELVDKLSDRWAVTKVFTRWSSLIGECYTIKRYGAMGTDLVLLSIWTPTPVCATP